MNTLFNIYCDESCHLEHDKMPVMGIGAVWAKKEMLREINDRIVEIKEKHKIPATTELKWTKLSASQESCYVDLINFFFDCSAINFRGVIVQEKNKLNHQLYNQTHDDFYYKIYFLLLKNILHKHFKFNVYLDIKDTLSACKLKTLKNYLENQNYDFSHEMLGDFQNIRSDEIQIMQLVDILLGALVYNKRNLTTSSAKLNVINLIKKRSSNYNLRTTFPSEEKFNLYYFTPSYSASEDLF